MGQANKKQKKKHQQKQAQQQAQKNFAKLDPEMKSGFQPDFGQKCHKVGKTRYEMNMHRWMQELSISGILQIPHRTGEFTMTLGYGEPVREYCATWGISAAQRSEIADLMRQGHCGFYIDFEAGAETVSRYEVIRPLHITQITPSRETYTAKGDFTVITTQGSITLTALADGFEHPRSVELETA